MRGDSALNRVPLFGLAALVTDAVAAFEVEEFTTKWVASTLAVVAAEFVRLLACVKSRRVTSQASRGRKVGTSSERLSSSSCLVSFAQV